METAEEIIPKTKKEKCKVFLNNIANLQSQDEVSERLSEEGLTIDDMGKHLEGDDLEEFSRYYAQLPLGERSSPRVEYAAASHRDQDLPAWFLLFNGLIVAPLGTILGIFYALFIIPTLTVRRLDNLWRIEYNAYRRGQVYFMPAVLRVFTIGTLALLWDLTFGVVIGSLLGIVVGGSVGMTKGWKGVINPLAHESFYTQLTYLSPIYWIYMGYYGHSDNTKFIDKVSEGVEKRPLHRHRSIYQPILGMGIVAGIFTRGLIIKGVIAAPTFLTNHMSGMAAAYVMTLAGPIGAIGVCALVALAIAVVHSYELRMHVKPINDISPTLINPYPSLERKLGMNVRLNNGEVEELEEESTLDRVVTLLNMAASQ